MSRKSKYHLDPYSSPRTSKRGCLCKGKNTYSRKCCKGGLINQGIGEIVTFYPPKYVEPEGNPNGEVVLVRLYCGEFNNRGTGVSWEGRDLNNVLQSGFLTGSGQSAILTRTGYLNTITDTDGGWLYAVHGGRINITQLTNTNAVASRSPQGFPDYATDGNDIPITEIGTIAPLATWTGDVTVASFVNADFIGDTVFTAPQADPYVTLFNASDVTFDAWTQTLAPALVYNNG
jgi:hypothetical protein